MVHKKGEYKQSAPVYVFRAAVHPTSTSSFGTKMQMQMYLSLAQNLIQHSTLFYTLHAILKSLQKVHNFDATNERAMPGGLWKMVRGDAACGNANR